MGMEFVTPYFLVLFAASLALASLSYHFIEQPFRHGVRVTRIFVFSSSAVFVAVLAVVSALGLVRSGFVDRFSPTVVLLDKARFKPYPASDCDGKPVGACMLGHSEGNPSVLIWGDSHMLAWAPALNNILAKRSTQAVFVTNDTCPPLLEVKSSRRVKCAAQNLDVKNGLLTHPDIKTVVMAAFWSISFRENGPLTASAGSPAINDAFAASNALISTLQWLHDNGVQAILIGPVPVYPQNVPLALALKQTIGSEFISSTKDLQRQKNAAFFSAVDLAKRGGGDFIFLDPIQWLCADACRVTKAGVLIYRDSNHLSVAGAMSLATNLSHELLTAPPKHNGVIPHVKR